MKPEREEQVCCENCFYGSKLGKSTPSLWEGCCRRHPPIGLRIDTFSPNFASVSKEDWCGEGLFWIEELDRFVPAERFPKKGGGIFTV